MARHHVLNASRADWKIWADFVNVNYRVVGCTDDDGIRRHQIDFASVEHLWDSQGQAIMLTTTFFVGEIDIRCHFFRDDELENDLDPRKITSYEVHQQLMDYLTRLSQALGKEVVLTAENDTPANCNPNWPGPWLPLLSVNGEEVRVYPYWLSTGAA